MGLHLSWTRTSNKMYMNASKLETGRLLERRKKKKTDKIVNKDWWWRLVREICSQAIHFQSPILRICSIFLYYRPDVFPSVCSTGVISIRHFALSFGATGKMTKLEPQQNFLFHTPQAENCPLFTLLAPFHPVVAGLQYMLIHLLRSMPDRVTSFLHTYTIVQFLLNA